MNCQKYTDMLAEYIEDTLSKEQRQALEQHLQTCPPCRAEMAQLTDLTERLTANAKKIRKTSLEDKVINQILQKQSLKLKQTKTTTLNLWRRIMETKITRTKIAVLCCVALVSVAAATVGPSLYDTVQSFLSATVEQRLGELVELADPESAVPHQMKDLFELKKASELEFVSIHADNEWALAITTDVVHVDSVYDEGRKQGPLVITLVKRDDVWLVTDIDLETEATVPDELERFFKNHPNAVEVNLR